MRRDILTALVLVGSAAAVGGCYESPDATVYEPGEYKGKHDPLLEKQTQTEQKDRLRERFNTVQTDR